MLRISALAWLMVLGCDGSASERASGAASDPWAASSAPTKGDPWEEPTATSPPQPSAQPTPQGSVLVGTWIYGSDDMRGFRDVKSQDLVHPPAGSGMRLELAADGRCVHSVRWRNTACLSGYVFDATADCRWHFDGATLTVELGAGVQRNKPCYGDAKDSASSPRTLSFQARVDGGLLHLVSSDGAKQMELRPES